MAARQSLTHVEHSRVLDVVTEKYGIVTGETMLGGGAQRCQAV